MSDELEDSQKEKAKLIYQHFIHAYLSRKDLQEQKTELILDTDSGALEDEAFLREVLTSLIESPDDEEFEHFLIAFAKANKQKNITLIKNPGVRDTILNLTLTALAPEFEEFEPEDFKMLFQDHLAPVLASLHPGSLAVIPNNISCHSYRAILTGLGQSVESLPLHLSDSLRSSIKSLKERFTRCSLPDSFMCKKTPVNENLTCAAVNRSHAPGNSKPSLSHALEALGEVRIANFSQTQLQSDDFVGSWFQTNIRPFLASTTPNFLFCLSSKNFSCETYQTVIKAFSSQRASMDREQQQAVYTHFIRPFLSRNDSSDPGCVSFNRGSKEWLQGNFGNFSGFAKLRDLQHLNANFSSAELLPLLTPTQVAELTLSSGALNDTDHIDRVFERLQEGDALENVEEFLTQLTANGKGPDFQPVVRDRVMNRTFSIISPNFTHFMEEDWFVWFHKILVPVLPSFSPMMIKSATANISCKNFQVVVSGMSNAAPAMSKGQRKGIGKALQGYLVKSASVINKPVCRHGIQSDAEWLEAYLGAFSQHVTYSDLKAFNLSAMAVVDSLSPEQKTELILDT
ncbi:uncharacterized protein LOC117540632 [Gymnodraco acuticeps]|uniref:Uncharacterized protein LOC117540632 n=1 Tax=Gymnodraco acuticeps TaxID=8218 RepID=A0A6P8TH52_GYMAC|nr:uncharacterized protein LOC117540632 [Gymnodraco acuticeps]